MVVEDSMFKFAGVTATIILVIGLTLTYLFVEKSITEEEVVITVINKEKFWTEDGKYFIFTPNEVFENSNNFFYRKTNADIVFKKLERGVSYRVKVVGLAIPSINRLRNITEVIGTEVKGAASD